MPVIFDFILPHLTPFVLVLSRIAGLFLFAPVLSSQVVPAQMKVFLALTLAAMVYPTIDHSAVMGIRPDLYELAPLILTETVIGASLGLFAAIPIMSVQLGGLLMGQQMGLGIASVINPGSDISGDVLGQMLFLMTLAGFVMIGGLELMVGGVIHTFAAVPPGGFSLGRTPLDVLVGTVTAGFDLALRIAMPVLAVIFMENVAVGFIMKTVPSLNIMNFGFPIRIALGLAVFAASLGFIRFAIEGAMGDAIEVIEDWVVFL